MSKYSSLCTAIRLIEAVNQMMTDHGAGSSKTAEIIADLQDIAKDARYGGQWEGDYEIIADSLGKCARSECASCSYNKIETGCGSALKKDAAAAIRQMGKELKNMKATMAEERKPAAWQKDIMESAVEPYEAIQLIGVESH